jgi:hypothetical protein
MAVELVELLDEFGQFVFSQRGMVTHSACNNQCAFEIARRIADRATQYDRVSEHLTRDLQHTVRDVVRAALLDYP